MIANFFHSLEQGRVDFLLISGQAAILYGAATFSEDIDIWIRPTAENAAALVEALRSQDGRYYKLTPPLELPYMLRGHGFHFAVRGTQELFLDVMAAPPRVSSYDDALQSSQRIDTGWGVIPTVGIRDLVALKMTQRMSDYPVIGRLALCYLDQQTSPGVEDLRWAIQRVYTLEDLDALMQAYPAIVEDAPPVLQRYLSADPRNGSTEDYGPAAAEWLTTRMLEAQQQDREYWRAIIQELRELRQRGLLMPVGKPV